ncbi:MAG TPA: ISKra4 family transposase, partial [Acetobacteraceae bacterium]|nr:ISKra4 family transposase [Acetobacteraceae bacterium]
MIETGMPGGVAGVDVMEISRPDGGASNIADLGLTLSEAKQLLACVQQTIVAAQARDLAARRPKCSSCSGR